MVGGGSLVRSESRNVKSPFLSDVHQTTSTAFFSGFVPHTSYASIYMPLVWNQVAAASVSSGVSRPSSRYSPFPTLLVGHQKTRQYAAICCKERERKKFNSCVFFFPKQAKRALDLPSPPFQWVTSQTFHLTRISNHLIWLCLIPRSSR